MGRYFTVEVIPTITASKQHVGAFENGDVLFDWVSFQIPRGASKLHTITAVLRSKDGDHQQAPKLDFYFAKAITGTAPSTLGVINAGVTGLPVLANHLLGMVHLDTGEFGMNAGESFTVGTSGSGGAVNNAPDLILEDDIDKSSFNTFYIAGVAGNAIDFGTTVLARGAATANGSLAVVETDAGSNDDPDAELIFAPGDVLHSGTDDVLGTVDSIAAFGSSKQDITFTSAIAATIADNEEIYNINPIRLILQFER